MKKIDALLIRYFAKEVMNSLAFGGCVAVRRKSYAISWAAKKVGGLTPEEKQKIYNKIKKGNK
jgi:hypothetical protein